METTNQSMESRAADEEPSKAEMKWTDVTDLFREAAASLTYKEPMIATSDFSLFEAMSAVELMDPKMDQCCGFTGSLKLEDLLIFEFPQNIDFSITAQVLESLFICEVQYIDGASLLESIHQCIFPWTGSWDTLTKIDSIYSKIMLSYSKDCVYTSSHMLKAMLHTDIYEEEDFQTSSRTSPNEDISNESNTIEEIKQIITSLNELNNNTDYLNQKDNIKKIILLLQLRIILHKLFKCFEEFSEEGMKITFKTIVIPQNYNSSIQNIHDITIEILEILQNVLEAFQPTEDSLPFYENPSVSFAFNPKIAKSLQVTPIRQITYFTFLNAIKYLKTLMEDLKIESEYIINIFSNNSLDYKELLHHFILISLERKHLFVRSLLWISIHYLIQKMPNLITQSMINQYIPGCILDYDLCCKWIQSIMKTFWDTLRAFMTHRNKLLPRLDNIFQYWGTIMREALAVDTHFLQQNDIKDSRSQYVTAWAMVLVTTVMDAHMGLVTELDLLGRNELDYWYWYWDYIVSSQLLALSTLRELSYELSTVLLKDNQKAAAEGMKALRTKSIPQKDKSRQKLNFQRILDEPLPLPLQPSIEELILRVKSSIFKALFQNPQPLSIEAYQALMNSDPDASSEAILMSAVQCLRSGKNVIDDLKKMNSAGVGGTSSDGGYTYNERIAMDQVIPLLKVDE
eukprot:gene8517-17560_t